jgi:hypothetical protein
MQHHRFPEMTFGALNNRADSTAIMDTVAELIGGDDTREVDVFLRNEQDDLGEDYGYRLVAKEVIGVALCDVDAPYAMPEILDRDQAAELLGQGFVDNMESME